MCGLRLCRRRVVIETRQAPISTGFGMVSDGLIRRRDRHDLRPQSSPSCATKPKRSVKS